MSLSRRVSLHAVVLCLFVAASAAAATNMYIKFEAPAIEGSSTAKGHEQQIEILSWSHGFVQPTSPTRSAAGGGTVEQATHQNLTFTKYLDATTNTLLKYCWSGKQFGKVTITCERNDATTGNKTVTYLTVAMQNVIIANYSISGGAGDVPVDNVSLDYGTIQYTYPDHSANEVPQSMNAAPALRAGAAAQCSMKLPGATSALPVRSWNLTKAGFTFTVPTSASATEAVAAAKKLTAGGSATLTCGNAASLTMTDAKIGQVSNANNSTNVTVTFGAIE